MKVLFLTAVRVPDVPSPLVVHVAELLRVRGHQVEQVTAERELLDLGELLPEHDLYVLKSHTELSLSIAAALDEQGARLLNPLAACAATQDKVRCHRRLAAAGLPVPRTLVTGDCDSAAGALRSDAPLVVKPLRGHRGVGVEVIAEPERLRGRVSPRTPVLVQDFVRGPGEDLKVYVVGRRVWAVRKPFSPFSFTQPGRPVSVSRDLADIALRAGAALGLGVYGLDLVEGPEGPVVVDLNYFPGYKGCSDVAAPMAAYVEAYARGRIDLALPAFPDLRTEPRVTGAALKPVP
jgi:ribosomal protein S6--L-glutamate ligase